MQDFQRPTLCISVNVRNEEMSEEETEERHPYEEAEERADALGLEGDEREDYIEGRMKRAGYRRGPGAWISANDDDDDKERDDDDEPMTRGDWRKMQRERRSKSYTPPPKKKRTNTGEDDGKEGAKKKRRDPWW